MKERLQVPMQCYNLCFFFQAEDGIRDTELWLEFRRVLFRSENNNNDNIDNDDNDDDNDDNDDDDDDDDEEEGEEIGRASCKERV